MRHDFSGESNFVFHFQENKSKKKMLFAKPVLQEHDPLHLDKYDM